ncbi:MAG: tail fiber domain-containing protein [Planctomycetes bacterium]|nr:tail fiber domain-containing protein [Planctomycetota bacterium]
MTGNMGVGGAAVGANPIDGPAGSFLSAAGVWTDGSSRTQKFDIRPLEESDAIEAFHQLQPVRYRYYTEPDEEYLGFIAEDVPELVAVNSRKGLSSKDIVTVLTRVVQVQQRTIDELKREVSDLKKTVTGEPAPGK